MELSSQLPSLRSPGPVEICFCLHNGEDAQSRFYFVKPPTSSVKTNHTSSAFEVKIGSGFSWTMKDSFVYVLGGSTSETWFMKLDTNHIDAGWHKGHPLIVGRKGAHAAFLDGKLFMMGGNNDNSSEINSNPWAEFYEPISSSWKPHPLPSPDDDFDFSAADVAGRYFLFGHADTIYIFDGYSKIWRFFHDVRCDTYLEGRGLLIDKTFLLVYEGVLYFYHLYRREHFYAKIMGLEEIMGFCYPEEKSSLIHLEGSIEDSPDGAYFCLVWSDLRSCDVHPSSKCLHVHCARFWAVLQMDCVGRFFLQAFVESVESHVIDCDPDRAKSYHFQGALPQYKIWGDISKDRMVKRVMTSQFRSSLLSSLEPVPSRFTPTSFNRILSEKGNDPPIPPSSQKLYFRVYNEKDDVSRFYHVNIPTGDISTWPVRISHKWQLKTGRQSSWIRQGSVMYVLGGYSSLLSCKQQHVFCIDTNQPVEDWCSCPSMIASRSGAKAGFLNGKLFMMGGKGEKCNYPLEMPLVDSETCSQQTLCAAPPSEHWAEFYDPNSKIWTSLNLPRPNFTPTFSAFDDNDAGQMFLGDIGILQAFNGHDWVKLEDYVFANVPFQGEGLVMNDFAIFIYKDALCSLDLASGITELVQIVGLTSLLNYNYLNCKDLPTLVHLNSSISDRAGAYFCMVWSDRRPCDVHQSVHPRNYCLHVHCAKFHVMLPLGHPYEGKLFEASVLSSASYVIDCIHDSIISSGFEGALLV